ncbi:reverse transcriptase [Fusarium bulbicola]|nr:reverse transcriptase [Fusarium bulbicola]
MPFSVLGANGNYIAGFRPVPFNAQSADPSLLRVLLDVEAVFPYPCFCISASLRPRVATEVSEQSILVSSSGASFGCSDHFTLSLALPDIRPAPIQSGKVRVTTEDELKRFIEIVELKATRTPLVDPTPAERDELASALVNLLTSAVKAANRPTRKGARTAPWWTEECAGVAASFRAIGRLYPLDFNQDLQIAKRDFHRVIRRAKRLYWRNLIDSFTDSSAVFKAVRWLKSPGPFQPPPLQVGAMKRN